ncbi:hypothetical protein OG206_04880 [Streptomyces sp. NBC_01341]|uniref:hypothetical protein n=1 Tax=Streptomyces sp. NBC_01341 TaxID=2903831 RepID=UPI002E0F6484|nr:hypothetical protein OG206_04880 [Streptomyces sp. NBC_01341]
MHETRVRTTAPEPAVTAPHDRPGGPLPWLTAVGLAFLVLQLVVVVPGSGLAWDETVYVSQAGGNAPPAFFSAPRARGISYLVAPVAALTASTAVLRIYLALLSAGALVAALYVWRKVLPTPVLVCAGAFFAGLWPTLFYGSAAMPNPWCALGALAATGWVARPVRDGAAGRREAVGAGAAVAIVALMRPADGFWLALPLVLAVVVVPGRRRPGVGAALVAGLVAGCAPWTAEAYARYGGLGARLHRAGEIQGGLGWNIAVDDHLRALAGRTLCRPCDIGWESPGTALWLTVLPVLVVVGVVVARRSGRGAVVLLAALTGLSMAVPYLFLVGYAAPRFLLPAYALLSVPLAECLVHLFMRARHARRPGGVALLALVLAAHLTAQFLVVSHVVRVSRATTARFTAMAGALNRSGVKPPCVVSGADAVPIAYYAGCASRQTAGHDASTTPAALREAARHVPTAVLVAPGEAPPAWAGDRRTVPLPPGNGAASYRGYVLPVVAPDGTGQARRPR